MKFTNLLKRLGIVLGLGIGTTLSLGSIASADTFRSETNVAGSGAYLGMVAFASVISKYAGHNLEVKADIAVSKSMVALGRAKADITNVVLPLVGAMKNGKGPYKKLSNSAEVAEGIRMILTHPSGTYHIVTFDGSGIESMQDIKGKKVYTGPKNAAMYQTGLTLINGETGYKPGVDFEVLDLDMKGGEQAFLDGHVDVWIRPAPLGGALIEQVGVSRGVRFLGLTEKGMKSEGILKYTNGPGRTADLIPVGTYTGQANKEPVKTVGFWLGIGANKNVDADAVYEMTKAVWNNLDEYKSVAKAFFAPMTQKGLIDHMTAPLHLGAYRFYKEMGLDIPERLIPPEAATN